MESARLRAARLLAEHNIERPPTPDGLVYLMSDRLLVQLDDMPVELPGMLARNYPRSVIWLRKGDQPVRRRFTLWHEVGHFLMHMGIYYCLAKGARETRTERQADEFAANVLMPRGWLLRDLAEVTCEPRTLAQRYGVSLQAMTIRLRELGL